MSNSRHILIVEDELKIAKIHADYLAQQYFQTSIIDDGDRVIDWVQNNHPDLILLDIMLPGKDGISLCREIRTFSQVPIIMVTARVEEIDRILGLEIGANDYICKPFSPREVMARINALFRLLDSLPQRGVRATDSNGLDTNADRMEVRYKGDLIDLTPVEFRLLACLNKPPYAIYSRQQLVDSIYDDFRVITDRTVDTHVKNLRRKLKAAGLDDDPIQSVYGMGYRWSLPE